MQTSEPTPNTTPKRMQAYRARLRAAGLRPVQIWVPDVNAPGFAEEVRRQSLLVANDPSEKEVLDWIQKVADWGDE